MNIKQVIKVYLLLSVITCLLCPFTGIIALSNSIKASNADILDVNTIDHYLNRSYRWIIISFVAFSCIYVALMSFFLITYNNR